MVGAKPAFELGSQDAVLYTYAIPET